MENKNTVIALVLMLIVWSGFTYLFPQKPQQEEVKSETSTVVSEVIQTSEIVTDTDIPIKSEALDKGFVQDKNIVQKNIVVENDKFIATFSNVGAAITSFQLKNYRQTSDKNSAIVSVVDKSNGVPTFLVKGDNSLFFDDKFIYETDSPELVVVKDKSSVSFVAVNNKGLVITKTYNFTNVDYLFDCEIKLENRSSNSITGNLSVSLDTLWNDDMKGNRFDFIGPASLIADELKTDSVDDVKEKSVHYASDIQWTGFENKYFMASMVPLLADSIDKLNIVFTNNSVNNIITLKSVNVEPGQTYINKFELYFGPKDVNQLKLAGHGLVKVVDFGFFELLAKPLHTVLNFFYGFIGNYGVSIILLTIILKLIFWPLTQKSYVSMRAMQTLQPEMKKLREKYSGDKESLNKKMMELYKEHRVNPMGGCLPMLVQIPVFFALYKVLLGTIELRHAPFAFWITDLSIKDPYYITPVVMGLTMFVQQKLTPSTMDPMQAKLMMAMPLVFTFMFLNFPAGLVIYWLVNNLLTIFQQYLIYRKPA